MNNSPKDIKRLIWHATNGCFNPRASTQTVGEAPQKKNYLREYFWNRQTEPVPSLGISCVPPQRILGRVSGWITEARPNQTKISGTSYQHFALTFGSDVRTNIHSHENMNHQTQHKELQKHQQNFEEKIHSLSESPVGQETNSKILEGHRTLQKNIMNNFRVSKNLTKIVRIIKGPIIATDCLKSIK